MWPSPERFRIWWMLSMRHWKKSFLFLIKWPSLAWTLNTEVFISYLFIYLIERESKGTFKCQMMWKKWKINAIVNGHKFYIIIWRGISKKFILVVCMCIIFVCIHSVYALPGWRHVCSLKKMRVGHFGLVCWWREETHRAGKKV